ncbi:MAG: TRAP transporter small permease [Pseudomonadota bacterium]
MAGSSKIRTDESLLSRLDRGFFSLESFLNFIGGVVILAVVLLAVANIIGRKFFNTPVDGYIDWVEQSMGFFAFFGIAYCHRLGGHIRMDIFVGFLKGRALWLFELLATTLMLLLTVPLIYGAYLHFNRAFVNGDSSFDIDLPTWPAKLVVPVMLSVLAVRLILHVWAYARALRTGDEHPVAVPLIEDVATQVRNEAEAAGVSYDKDGKES